MLTGCVLSQVLKIDTTIADINMKRLECGLLFNKNTGKNTNTNTNSNTYSNAKSNTNTNSNSKIDNNDSNINDINKNVDDNNKENKNIESNNDNNNINNNNDNNNEENNSNIRIWNPSLKISPLNKRQKKYENYDISIEVSGNSKGLQTAIDSTGKNGKIIIGSWYGEKFNPLKLGLKFHRSGISLLTSQVSNIPYELSGRWDKLRRFNLTWDCIKKIKPSRCISSIVKMNTNDVLAAYQRLEKGEDVTVLFIYD